MYFTLMMNWIIKIKNFLLCPQMLAFGSGIAFIRIIQAFNAGNISDSTV